MRTCRRQWQQQHLLPRCQAPQARTASFTACPFQVTSLSAHWGARQTPQMPLHHDLCRCESGSKRARHSRRVHSHLVRPRKVAAMIGSQQLHLRAPAATCPVIAPRSCPTSHRKPAAVQPQAAFTQSTAQLRPQAAGCRALRRSQRLQVLAAASKKSVGDLSKAELEGKVVFVSTLLCQMFCVCMRQHVCMRVQRV